MAKRNLPNGFAIPIEPGTRDRRVTIEQQTPGSDSTGFPTETWSTLAAVWMYREDIAGDERFQSDRLLAVGRVRWEMTYRADMDPEAVDVPKLRRLVASGRYYDIVAASVIGRREGIEIVTLLNTSRTSA